MAGDAWSKAAEKGEWDTGRERQRGAEGERRREIDLLKSLHIGKFSVFLCVSYDMV